MIEPFLQLTADCLAAALSDEPRVDAVESGLRESRRERRRAKRRGESAEAPEGRLWSKTIPGTKEFIPYVMAYCREQKIRISAWDLPAWTGDITSISPNATGLVVSYTQQLGTRPEVLATRQVPYPAGPNGKFASLCQGKRTSFGGRLSAQISPANLLFKAGSDGEVAVIEWKNLGVFYDGPWIFDTSAVIERIEISADGGECVLAGWKNVLVPRLAWGD